MNPTRTQQRANPTMGSARLFTNPLLERFTRTHIAVLLTLWLPLTTVGTWYASSLRDYIRNWSITMEQLLWEIWEEHLKVALLRFGVHAHQISDEADLKKDLGLNSVDYVHLISQGAVRPAHS